MKKDWLSVFDEICCEDAWKKAVLQEIEHLPQKRRKRRIRLLAGGLAAICLTSTAVMAYGDRLQEWLQEQFFDEEHAAEVTPHPSSAEVKVQEMEAFTLLDDGLYAEISEEQLVQTESIDVYRHGEKIASSLKKQKKELRLPLGNAQEACTIWYVQLGEEYYPLLPLSEDDAAQKLLSAEKLPGSSRKICIVYEGETGRNSYLADLESGEVNSIGDMEVEDGLKEAGLQRYYAIDPQSSNGSKILYRTNYKDGSWQEEKKEWAWMVYDVAANKRFSLPEEFTKNALLDNEIAFVDERHLIAVAHDVSEASYYPLIYDCESGELEEFKEHSCNVPFTSSYIYRMTKEGIELYHITDKKTKELQLSDPEEAVVEIYDAYCFLKDDDGTIAQVYLQRQDRWISFDQLPKLYGSMITSASVLDEATLLLSADSREGRKEYIVSFS